MHNYRKGTLVLASVCCCALNLLGCSDRESQQARTRAEAAEARLKEVEAISQAVQRERDDLKTKVNELTQSLQGIKAKLDAAVQLKDSTIATFKEQADRLLGERDSALAKLATAQTSLQSLTVKFEEQLKKFSQLEGQNKQLQSAIDLLKTKLGSDVKLPEIPKLR